MDRSRFARRVALLAFAAAATLLASSLPTFAGAPKAAPAGRVATRGVTASTGRVASYWTAQRMRNAKPSSLEAAERGSAPAKAAAPQGEAVVVPPTGPRTRVTAGGATSIALARRASGPFPYSRYEITTPEVAPYSTAGKVFFSLGGGNYVCSGTAVASENKSVVMTAGHCVVDGGSGVWTSNWAFVPGYRNGSAPFGVWPAQSLSSPQDWVNSGNLRYDMGAAIVAPNSSGQYLTDVVGGRGIAWNLPVAQAFRSFGYPAAPPFDGSKLFVCDSNFGEEDVFVPGSGPNPIGIGCDMTGGSSGGGWIIQDSFVNSVNSYKIVGENEVMYGPYFGSAAESLYNSVRGSSPPSPSPTEPGPSPTPTPTPTPTPPPDPEPTTHDMDLSLKLVKSLVAKGRMTAPDGYLPCTRNAPVKVQRRVAGHWKTLKKVVTNDTGRYRASVKDKPGRYRAFSPSGLVDEANLCSAATSPTRVNR